MTFFNQLLEAQRLFQHEILSRGGVIGVGLGYKDKRGELTDELALMALVEQKKPKEALRDEDMVPKEIDGAKTDVLEIGQIRAQTNLNPRDIWRPLIPPGVSIGHYLVTAGTFGALVYDRQTGEPLILSNNHVLANSNAANLGDMILQPAGTDGGERPNDMVARLARFAMLQYIGDTASGSQQIIREAPRSTSPVPEPPKEPVLPLDPLPPPPTAPTAPAPTVPAPPAPATPLPAREPDGCAALFTSLGNMLSRANTSQTWRTTAQAVAQAFDPIHATSLNVQSSIPENRIDAALARPVDPSMFTSEIRHIGRITGTTTAQLGMRVRKTGRTSDYTEGMITVMNTTVDVGYTVNGARRTARFVGQIMVTGMSLGGDSGSLIVDQFSQNAVGLLFAGSGTTTVFTPITLVLDTLDVQLVPLSSVI